jgi:HAD superfamily hydrolase (TIGR01509 family)
MLRVMDEAAPVEAVMFDMDGTLVDSRSAIVGAYHDASTEILGEPYPVDPVELEAILKLRGAEAFPRIVGDDPERVEEFGAAFHAAYTQRQEKIPAFPGLVDALQALLDLGVSLGIATSKARERLDLDLRRIGVADYFAFTVSGDEVPNGKPAPDPIFAVAAGLGVAPENGLYVGDGENDVIAAHAAGMRAAGVAFGFHPEECRAAGPEYFVSSYAELVDVVAATQPART